MRRILVVLAIIAGTAFIGVAPASAEDDPAGDTVTTTETTPDTTAEEAPAPEPEVAPAPEPEAAPVAEPTPETTEPSPESDPVEALAPSDTAPADEQAAPQVKVADVAEADVVVAAVPPPTPEDKKVTLCHFNEGNEDFFTVISVSKETIWNGNSEHLDDANDIIPPFTNEDGTLTYPGKNYTAQDYQECQDGGLIEVTALEPTLDPPTCELDGSLTLPSIEGVVYTSDPTPIDGPGSYHVTAEAADGYILSADSFTEGDFTVLEELEGAPDCVQVTLCHATWANPQATNEYVVITIDEDGVHGHDGHTGPIFQPGDKEAGVHWGDIIPPVEGILPDGLNWTPEGQAILRNGCNLVDLVDQTVPDFVLLDRCTGNIVDDQDDTTQIVPLAGDGNYTWEFTKGDGQDGPWTLEFTANDGFELTGETTFSGDAGTAADCVAPSDETLPNTGGSSLWVLVMGGALALAGLLVLSGRGALGLVGLTGPVPVEAPTSAWVQTVATKRQVAAVQAKPSRGLLAMLGGLLALVIASLFGRRP